MMKIVVVLLAILSVAFAVSDFYSTSDVAAAKTLAEGLSTSDISSLFYAVKLLDGKHPKSADICKTVEKAFNGDVASIYYAVEVGEALGCFKSQINGDAVKKLVSALEGDSLVNQYYAIAALKLLEKNKHANKVEQPKYLVAFEKIVDSLDSDGTFKLNEEQSDGSAYYAGLAYKAISTLYSSLEGDEDKEKVTKIVGSISNLLDNAGEETGRSLSFSHSDSSVSTVRTTSNLIEGILSLSKALGKEFTAKIEDDKITQMAEFLVSQKQTSSVETAYSVVSGLKALNSGSPFKKPIVLSLAQNTLQSSAKKGDGDVTVRVTDLFGGATPACTVYLVRAFASGATPLITNQQLTASGDSFSFNFIGAKPEAGAYQIEFRVTPTTEASKWIALGSASRKVRVVTSIEVTDAELSIASSKDDESPEKHSLTSGKKLAKDLTVAANKHLFITFRVKNKVSGKSLTVQQAFVTFTDSKTKQDVFFVTPYDTAKKVYKLHVDASKFKNRSGSYSLKILIGDPFIDNSFEWEVTNVNFNFSGDPQEDQAVFVPKPEINHVFRKPEARAPQSISKAFTALVLAPFLFLLIGLATVGLNFGNFPGGLTAVFALLFHVTLGGVLAVLGLYWLELTIFDTLKYLGALSLPLLFFGQQTLRGVALTRLGKKE